MKKTNQNTLFRFPIIWAVLCVFIFQQAAAQEITSSVDTTQIKIGEQVRYRIQVETNADETVIFPEQQSFLPLEMVEAYKIDTTKLKESNNLRLTREYALTQWDSGSYTLPRQKVQVNERTLFTDSVTINVANVTVDTTKQKMYPVKSKLDIEKPLQFPLWILWIVLGILALAGLVFLFIKLRKRKLEREKQLPPYEKAIQTLKKLDESKTLEEGKMKSYYSTLTLAVKRYIDEEIDERALESTTEELIARLTQLKQNNQTHINQKVIDDLAEILRRADLIKFAGGSMDRLTAKKDRQVIEEDITNIKTTKPEPTEEERLKDEAYKEELKKKEKRKKIILFSGVTVAVLVVGFFILVNTKGFAYVKDFFINDSAKDLLKQEWVASEYGYPPVSIITPEVLVREEPKPEDVPPQLLSNKQGRLEGYNFVYGNLDDNLHVKIWTMYTMKEIGSLGYGDNLSEQSADALEEKGAKNIIFKEEEFTASDGTQGLKVYGSFIIEDRKTKKEEKKSFVHIYFKANNGNETLFVSVEDDDPDYEEISNRIINSVKFNPIN